MIPVINPVNPSILLEVVMVLSIADIRDKSKELVTDLSDKLGADADHEACVPAAYIKLSQYKPQLLYVDVTGDGETYRHELSSWKDDSIIIRVEYPIDEEDLNDASWIESRNANGKTIILSELIPDSEDFRVWYSAWHTDDDTDTTVPDQYLEMVGRFCAAIMLRRMGTNQLQSRRAGVAVGPELVDFTPVQQSMKDYANMLDREALELLGVVQDDAISGSQGGGSDDSTEVALSYVSPSWRI